ncbi:RNA polymerase sigma factor [Sphaerisporangium perillae]|uniref:RNA polymerase sigma factor n=1 Tax=Sphaerisporangium perillae TaxID=2935860 RepID=UPI00200E5D0C|nr:sigma factor [Sphaerisporangium perillae]
MSRDHANAQERFRCLYAEHVDPILGFAMRRTGQADDAADIVAETFLVAWRRIDEVPGRVDRVQCRPGDRAHDDDWMIRPSVSATITA